MHQWVRAFEATSAPGFTNADRRIDGRIKFGEEFVDGFDKLSATFLTLFDGSHSGKKLIVRNG